MSDPHSHNQDDQPTSKGRRQSVWGWALVGMLMLITLIVMIRSADRKPEQKVPAETTSQPGFDHLRGR
jgi:hypothetical protein